MHSLWSGVILEAKVMEEFEKVLTNSINHVEYRLSKNNDIEAKKQSLYKKLFDIAIELNNNPLNEDFYGRSDLHEMVDRLWKRYEQQLNDVYARRDTIVEQRINEIIENKNQQFTKRDKVTMLQFYKALFPKRTMNQQKLEKYADQIYTGSQSLLQWYNIYLQRRHPKPHFSDLPVIHTSTPEPTTPVNPAPVKRIHKPKPFKVNTIEKKNIKEEQRKFLTEFKIDIDESDIMPYPFKSKIEEYKTRVPDVLYKAIPKDPKVKSRVRKLEKPYYSPYPHSWEIDLVFNLLEQGDVYLFCININTKYLVVYKIESKKASDVMNALDDLIKLFPVKYIRGDGEKAFAANDTRRFWQQHHVQTYFVGTKFTNHNRVVDSVIRTIRNAIGYRTINDDQLKQIIDYYNNTKHSGTKFTPIEMMEDIDKEYYHIRRCNERLVNVKKRLSEGLQMTGGDSKLKEGNIVIVHMELGKVASKFEKKRRIFDRLGVFQEYVHGNVRVKISPPVQISSGTYRNEVLVPEYCVRFVADSIDTLPEKYKRAWLSDVFIPMQEK